MKHTWQPVPSCPRGTTYRCNQCGVLSVYTKGAGRHPAGYVVPSPELLECSAGGK